MGSRTRGRQKSQAPRHPEQSSAPKVDGDYATAIAWRGTERSRGATPIAEVDAFSGDSACRKRTEGFALSAPTFIVPNCSPYESRIRRMCATNSGAHSVRRCCKCGGRCVWAARRRTRVAALFSVDDLDERGSEADRLGCAPQNAAPLRRAGLRIAAARRRRRPQRVSTSSSLIAAITATSRLLSGSRRA